MLDLNNNKYTQMYLNCCLLTNNKKLCRSNSVIPNDTAKILKLPGIKLKHKELQFKF